MDAKQSDVVRSNHADLFQPLFLMRPCSTYIVMHVTTREYEHVVNLNAGYWHNEQGRYLTARRATYTMSKNGVPFTQADINELSK
jgi:hypothetical protein